MFNEHNVLETINMIKLYNLDIRTVTMAISLRDCMHSDIDIVCENIYPYLFCGGVCGTRDIYCRILLLSDTSCSVSGREYIVYNAYSLYLQLCSFGTAGWFMA